MSGHSHWAGIKHKKGLADAKRGQLFSKLTKNIMIAARDNTDPSTNLQLRYAIDKAKESNMPKSNIERALKKMADKAAGLNFEELTYEGYGPGGVAILVEAVTDNRNRTASEFRNIFDSRGGNLGESGCVSYMFDKKGWISVACDKAKEDQLMEVILDEGAENITREDDFFEITMQPTDFQKVKAALEKAEIAIDSSELMQIPQNTITLDEKNGKKALALIETLEEHDDVQNVYSNYDIPQELLEKWEQEN